MKRDWKRVLWMLIRVVIGGGLLVLAFRQIDWSQIGAILASARMGWLLLALAAVLLGLLLRIWRWQLLLLNYEVRAGFWQIMSAFMFGQSANILMPVRGGELVRFGWLRTRYPHGAVPMAASIAIEKYLDMAMLLVFFVGVMPYLPLEVIEANLTAMIIGSGLLTVIIVAGAWSGPRIGVWLSHVLEHVGRPGSALQARLGWALPVARSVTHWLASNAWLQSPRRFLPAMALSLASWLVMALTNLLVMQAVGLAWDWRAAVLVQVLLIVGSVPALIPGNLGTFHFFAMLGLSLMGISGGKSAAFALFLHALITLPPLVISAGLLLVYRQAQDSKTVARHTGG